VLKNRDAIVMQEYDNYRSRFHVPSFYELDPEHQATTDAKAEWLTLFLRVYGVDTCFAKEFPETMKMVDESGMDAVTVMISRLAPWHKVDTHIGPSKIVLRYLQSIKIPDSGERCKIHVWDCDPPENCEPVEHVWTELGQELVFDDSFWHSSANPTGQERLVLFLDLKRPDMKGWRERLINNMVLGFIWAIPVPRKGEIISNAQKICDRASQGA